MISRFRITGFLLQTAWLLLCVMGDPVSAADESQLTPSQWIERFSVNGDEVTVAVRQAYEAGIGEDTMARMLSGAMERGARAGDVQRILRPMIMAGESGLPLDPFSDKVLEGFAKAVDTDLIVRVLDTKLLIYREAKQLLPEMVSQQEGDGDVVKAVALAMERGVSSKAMKQILSGNKYDSGTLGNTVQVAADLISMGFKEAESVAITRSGLDAGYMDKGRSTLTRIAALAQKSGVSTSDITETITAGLKRGMALSEISVELNRRGQHGGSGRGGQRGGYGGMGTGTGSGSGLTDGVGKRRHGK